MNFAQEKERKEEYQERHDRGNKEIMSDKNHRKEEDSMNSEQRRTEIRRWTTLQDVLTRKIINN